MDLHDPFSLNGSNMACSLRRSALIISIWDISAPLSIRPMRGSGGARQSVAMPIMSTIFFANCLKSYRASFTAAAWLPMAPSAVVS